MRLHNAPYLWRLLMGVSEVTLDNEKSLEGAFKFDVVSNFISSTVEVTETGMKICKIIYSILGPSSSNSSKSTSPLSFEAGRRGTYKKSRLFYEGKL